MEEVLQVAQLRDAQTGHLRCVYCWRDGDQHEATHIFDGRTVCDLHMLTTAPLLWVQNTRDDQEKELENDAI